ncbi:MAG: rpsT, partial [Sporomusa sp.]|nr:rpsT [Sporomusa sp.]
MPNIKASERSVKTDAERRARNYSVRSTIKTSI